MLESVEICAVKTPVPADGPQVFAGQTAIYFGAGDQFDAGGGMILPSNQPSAVSMGEASRLRALGRADIHVSEPTWSHAAGGAAASCC